MYLKKPDLHTILLLSVLLLGATLNFLNIQFGLPFIYGRNVERIIVKIVVDGFVSGDYNPHTAIYPHLHGYILLIALLPYYIWGWIIGLFASRADLLTVLYSDPTPLYLISRSVTALFGTASVLVVYAITRKFYERKVALVAALFLSCLPLWVENSHLITTDVILTFFILTTCYFSANIVEKGRFRDYSLAGVALGLDLPQLLVPLLNSYSQS